MGSATSNRGSNKQHFQTLGLYQLHPFQLVRHRAASIALTPKVLLTVAAVLLTLTGTQQQQLTVHRLKGMHTLPVLGPHHRNSATGISRGLRKEQHTRPTLSQTHAQCVGSGVGMRQVSATMTSRRKHPPIGAQVLVLLTKQCSVTRSAVQS